MSELNAEVKEFFDGYERANTDFEPQRIATFYADVFMFGAPQVNSIPIGGSVEVVTWKFGGPATPVEE